MAFGRSVRDPLHSAVGSLIDEATSGALPGEEWGRFVHICDHINATAEGPKDAIKALKKKLFKNYNHKEIRFTLSLLDMCVQNCGPSFQSLVVKKDFCKERLVKLLNPRYALPADTQDKILTFIMTWARGFQGTVDVSEVKEVYLELLKKGVQFPRPDTNTETKKALSQSVTKSSPLSSASVKCSLMPLSTASTIQLTPEQIGKLNSELDMTKMNVKVMSSILKENVPGSENPEDMNLLQKLYKTCRMMQERIMELLAIVQNEDVIIELIHVNEDLNNVLLGHERFSRNRVRFLENQRIQREHTEPSAPSCDLLDLHSGSVLPVSALMQNGAVTSQSSGLNCRSASAPDPNNPHPMLYPKLDLGTANAQQLLFATDTQSISQSSPAVHTYDNLLHPVPLHLVNLQNGNALSLNEALPGATPADESKSKSQPQYYEIMEFDPLAPSDATEAIYEEIDAYLSKPEVKDSKC
ncbi:PREDICTED: TOM1-like protein 1 [Gavialis gangeticus]|uniref:TOM1-like protein 1 n=1 Tax=Gavialis gangeticus TaxID=94835 RepID=UPI00092EB55E|nr:PREDICTED: TOM1-like protein 1 [Gavialis gangeticus]